MTVATSAAPLAQSSATHGQQRHPRDRQRQRHLQQDADPQRHRLRRLCWRALNQHDPAPRKPGRATSSNSGAASARHRRHLEPQRHRQRNDLVGRARHLVLPAAKATHRQHGLSTASCHCKRRLGAASPNFIVNPATLQLTTTRTPHHLVNLADRIAGTRASPQRRHAQPSPIRGWQPRNGVQISGTLAASGPSAR